MSECADLRSINALVEHCLPGEWGIDPVGGASNCVVYRATDIDNEGHLRHDEGAERVVLLNKVTAKALKANDIIVEASGGAPDKPVGRVALFAGSSRKPALVSNFFRAMRPRAGVDAKFLTFQLVALNRSSAIWRYQQQTTGLINLKVTDYLKHRVWMPALSVQQKIAAILTSLDTAIEKTEALIEKHQQIKAGLMHDLFTRGVLPNGQLRPLREQAPELYEETSHGWMPRGWEATTLRACLAEGATNGIYKPAHLIGSGVLLIGQTALTPDRSVDPELARRAIIEAAELQRFGVYADDILVSRVFATVEGVGQPALVPPLEEPAVFESNMMRFRVNAKLMRPRLLFEWLKTDRCRRHINGRANASNQASINQAVLYPMVVPVPPLDEQDRMLAAVGGCAARIAEDLATLSKQRCLKTGLMQDLLTGKVPVKVAATGVPA